MGGIRDTFKELGVMLLLGIVTYLLIGLQIYFYEVKPLDDLGLLDLELWEQYRNLPDGDPLRDINYYNFKKLTLITLSVLYMVGWPVLMLRRW